MNSENRYKTPDRYLYPLHMVRPRFKNNIENVLFYMSKEISGFTGIIDNEVLDDLISNFPGNKESSKKTLANWRTEISALFGLMQYQDLYGLYASSIAKRLADKEDLIEFFKNFVMKIQFPNGMLKPHVNKDLIDNGVRFFPFKFIVDLLNLLNDADKQEAYITKDELTYVVFDDIRFTSGNLKVSNARDIILDNRKYNVTYDKHDFVKGKTKESKGDQTRTALDLLDYMELGNLLIRNSFKYFLNELERDFINYGYKECGRFDKFDSFYNTTYDVNDLNFSKNSWFDYVNDLDFNKSATNIGKFIRSKSTEKEITLNVNDMKSSQMSTKDIGDMGEAIIITHEKNKLKSLGLEHNSHLVQFIPTHLGAGYDIKSMDEMDNQIFIEVKTTLSNHPLTQSRISLTKNEWNAAYTNGENYYVYRLIITNESRRLLIMNNPVELVKQGKIKLAAPKGVELIFKPDLLREVDILS
ncbi:DUF3883 domain-containing protein [Vibrio sp. S4M6]|uniref:protein NO VEIN domain-containing protein n=1 Tax=Vibrio sinus TaxID=2946865 RepID=UPI00202A9CD3|nr:DUF3883 domain-containing protein [Vibrio sinus]MCL9783244.1 DUF3883 domain-containing protein [Vibrio sinus]